MKKKTWLLTLGIFAIFILFIFFLTADSQLDRVLISIEKTENEDELKEVFEANRYELRGQKEFLDALKKRVLELNLNKKGFKKVLEWFPVPEQATNLIIVPDLSRRIIQFPDQPEVDQKIIDTIYGCFAERVRGKKINPTDKSFAHDRLLIDVADPSQANQNFSEIANNLVVDLNNNRSTSTRIWVDNARNGFRSALSNLYTLGISKPAGTDYWWFFQNKLSQYEMKNSLDTKYRNVLVILTDGYLETQSKDLTRNALNSNNPQKFPIPTCTNGDLSNWEVYVLEARERKPQAGEFDILRKCWFNWFESMNADIEEREFYQRNRDAFNITAKFVRENIMSLQ